VKRKIAVAVLQNSQGKILLLHRQPNRQNAADVWNVVSGHVESGETPADAIKREVLEELHIYVSEAKIYGKDFLIGDSEYHPFLFCLSDEEVHRLVLDQKEHDKLLWISACELPKFQTVPGLWTDLLHVQLRPKRSIIGVVGKNGSGKDTVVDHLVYAHGYVKLHLSDFVKEEAVRRGMPQTRTQLNALSKEMLENEGEEVFSQRALEMIEHFNWTKVAISGIRTTANIKTFTRFYNGVDEESQQKPFQLWSTQVSADQERFARMIVRGSPRDPRTFDEFLFQNQREEELFHVSDAESQADAVLENDRDLEYLYLQVSDLLQ
jgi:8-oxo-dGTP diphosphatase